MLYTKPINEVTWKDVEEFCKQDIAEGTILDYKEDFPNHLDKIIAAFANTFGGLILIGVEEKAGNKPQLPIKGIEYKNGLSEKVMQIVVSNISPVVIPGVKVCPNGNDDRAVIVIRVPQSHMAPHAVNNNTEVYFRTNDINRPEKLMKLDNMMWLIDKRKKSEEFRELLINRFSDRFESLFINKYRKNMYQNYDFKSPDDECLLKLMIVPTFPEFAYKSPPEVLRFGENWNYASDISPHEEFTKWHDSLISYDSAIFSVSEKSSNEIKFNHTVYNIFGLFAHNEIVWQRIEETKFINIKILASVMDSFLESAVAYYNYIGFNGNLIVKFELNNIAEYKLARKPKVGGLEGFLTIENKVKGRESTDSYTLKYNKERILYNFLSKIAWAYNMKDFSMDIIYGT